MLNKVLRQLKRPQVTFALALIVFYLLCMKKEGFAAIRTAGGLAPREVFNAKHSLECVAGAGPYGQYSKALTPGGYCDLQSKVRSSHDYKIEDGGPYGAPLA